MKKILVLASTFPRWSNDTTPPFVLELEKRLATEFEIHVLAPHYKGARKKETMEGLTVHRFQYFWPASQQGLCYDGGILPNLKRNKFLYVQAFTLIFFEFFAAARLVRKEKIHIVHAHWIIPQGIIAYLIHKIYHTPYIVTTHGGDIYGLNNKIILAMKKMILENAKSITVVSNAIKEEIHKKINPSLKVEVISMGVDAKLFNPDKFDESLKKKYKINGPFLLFVGRLAEKKGVQYLLKALPTIIKVFPKTVLVVIGEGTLKYELVELAKELNISKNVIFTGSINNSDLPKYYATADIFIGPSIQLNDGDTEGLGLTFVEALLSGCIPIGTNVGGISDVIQNEKTGILIDERNPKSIANSVMRLLKENKLIKSIKKNSREMTIKKFDWPVIKLAYKDLYSD
jgi:glycosyltransferase involved in cell wall biosynthesis